MQFNGYQLIKREIIGRAALTPTDLLHVRGDFTPWDVDAAHVAVEMFTRIRGWMPDQLVERMFEVMTDSILTEIVQFLTRRRLVERDLFTQRRDIGRWFFDNSFNPNDKYLGTNIKLRMPLIGIGAPAGIFLPRIATALGTEFVLPEYYAVANAIGAVAGSVVATCEAIVYTHLNEYIAQVGEMRGKFTRLPDAMQFARTEAARQAESAALRSGAVSPYMTFEEIPNGTDSYRIKARAAGNPCLSSQK